MRRVAFCTCFVLLLVSASVLWAQLPYIGEEEIGSRIVEDWMEKAAEHAGSADARAGAGAFTEAAFDLEDAETMLSMATEFALPANHPAVVYVQDLMTKARQKLEMFGGGESEEQLAKTWFDRIYWDHWWKNAKEVMDDEEVDGVSAYWLARYVLNVMLPDLQKCQEKYPTEDAIAAFYPDAAGNWNQAVEALKEFGTKYTGIIQASLPTMQQEVRTRAMKLLDEDCLTSDLLRALDSARLLLAVQPEDQLALKTKEMAEQRILERRKAQEEAYRERLESARMPTEVQPGDAALHQQMKAAYLEEIQKRDWSPGDILRVVVSSNWSEGWEAWWVGNEVHAGYFKKIYGAVGIKQASGCWVKQCLFRQQRVEGQWGDLYLAKVITGYSILEENINK